MKERDILSKVSSGDRVIVRDYINGWIVADDIVKNLLNKSQYNTDYEVYKISIDDGCLCLWICE